MNVEEKLDILLRNQELLNNKIDIILQGLSKNDVRANTSIFIQGLFLSDLLESWGNLNGR